MRRLCVTLLVASLFTFIGRSSFATSLFVESDASTLSAVVAPGVPTAAELTRLNNGNTAGLTFHTVYPGAQGSLTVVPAGDPTAEVVSFPLVTPGTAPSGFFEVSFDLPSVFDDVQLTGAANVDDAGRAFLNGNPLTPALNATGHITEFTPDGTAFSTSDASFFVPGENVLLIADDNTGGPSGTAFYADITYTPVPEPATMTLLGLGLATLIGRRINRRSSR